VKREADGDDLGEKVERSESTVVVVDVVLKEEGGGTRSVSPRSIKSKKRGKTDDIDDRVSSDRLGDGLVPSGVEDGRGQVIHSSRVCR
jgi:hypothetical protein